MTQSEARETAFVTGGASGIGFATATALARRGANVVVYDQAAEGTSAAVADIEASGGEALGIVGDVSSGKEVAEACEQGVDHFGGLNIVVACAGIDAVGTVDTLDEALWLRCLAVNLTGVFLVAKHSVPHLLATGRGSFVAVSSAAGLRGLAGEPAYSATKHGVVGLIRTMALDYGPHGLRVNAVCPGFIATPMVEAYFRDLAPPGEPERRLARIPMRRFGTPEEVAELIAHLTSAEASYTNGATHVIDGAAYAGYWRQRSA